MPISPPVTLTGRACPDRPDLRAVRAAWRAEHWPCCGISSGCARAWSSAAWDAARHTVATQTDGRSIDLARSWLAPVELFVIIAMAGAVHSSSAADLPRLPLLQFVEQALRLPSARPSAGLKADGCWDVAGAVRLLSWAGADEVVAVSSLPDEAVMRSLHFVRVGDAEQPSVVGDYLFGLLGSPRIQVLRRGAVLACVAVDRADHSRGITGAVELDIEVGQVIRLEPQRSCWAPCAGRASTTPTARPTSTTDL